MNNEDIERVMQTGSIKEQVYRDKLNYLYGLKESLRSGKFSEFASGVEELNQHLEEAHRVNQIMKEIELQRVQEEYAIGVEAVKREFEEKKLQLKETLLQELEEKRKMVEHEYQNLELQGESSEIKPISTRKLRRRPNEPPPRDDKLARKASPSLKFLLQDREVSDDLIALGLASESVSLAGNREVNGTATSSEPASIAAVERKILTPGDPGAIIDNGKVYYENKCYLRGQSVYVETSDTGKVPASIQSIGDMEVSLKSVGDYKKITISLWELRDGKAILRKRKH